MADTDFLPKKFWLLPGFPCHCCFARRGHGFYLPVFPAQTASLTVRGVFLTLRGPVRGAREILTPPFDYLGWSGIISEWDKDAMRLKESESSDGKS